MVYKLCTLYAHFVFLFTRITGMTRIMIRSPYKIKPTHSVAVSRVAWGIRRALGGWALIPVAHHPNYFVSRVTRAVTIMISVTGGPEWSSSGILTTWHKRVQTCLYHVCTVYVQCYSTSADIHCIYISRNVFTCMYMFIQLGKYINTSVHGMYMVCTSSGINVYVHRSDIVQTCM